VIETQHTYRRDIDSRHQIRIKVLYDTAPHTQTYLSYQGDTGEQVEILIGHSDLPPLIDMLIAAQDAPCTHRGAE
jgi:hypothetical protein